MTLRVPKGGMHEKEGSAHESLRKWEIRNSKWGKQDLMFFEGFRTSNLEREGDWCGEADVRRPRPPHHRVGRTPALQAGIEPVQAATLLLTLSFAPTLSNLEAPITSFKVWREKLVDPMTNSLGPSDLRRTGPNLVDHEVAR